MGWWWWWWCDENVSQFHTKCMYTQTFVLPQNIYNFMCTMGKVNSVAFFHLNNHDECHWYAFCTFKMWIGSVGIMSSKKYMHLHIHKCTVHLYKYMYLTSYTIETSHILCGMNMYSTNCDTISKAHTNCAWYFFLLWSKMKSRAFVNKEYDSKIGFRPRAWFPISVGILAMIEIWLSIHLSKVWWPFFSISFFFLERKEIIWIFYCPWEPSIQESMTASAQSCIAYGQFSNAYGTAFEKWKSEMKR